jgi:hypothetical protein
MAGEECPMMLSSIHSQALKVGITKRKAEETAMAGEKGCTTESKAAASSGDGGLKEEKLQVEVKPLTLISDSDINQPEELHNVNISGLPFHDPDLKLACSSRDLCMVGIYI